MAGKFSQGKHGIDRVENLARWLWERLKPELAVLTKVVVRETCDARCEYEGA